MSVLATVGDELVHRLTYPGRALERATIRCLYL